MSAAEIKAGRAAVEIIARDRTDAGINTAMGRFKSMGAGLKSVASMISSVTAGISASAVTAALAASVKLFADTGSEINDIAGRTGMATDALQHFKFAADQSGASIADVEAALRKMAKNGRSVGDFEKLGQEIAAIQDPSERAARAMEEFGKSGTKLLPMFAEWKSLKAASQALGPILTPEEVARADALGDAFASLHEVVKRASQQIGDTMAPELQRALNVAIGITAEFAKWAKESKGSNRSFASGALAGMGLGFGGKFINKSLSAFEKRGAKAIAESQTVGEVDDGEAVSRAAAAAARNKEIMQAIEAGNAERAAMMREFETPAERFLRKQKEILTAIQMVNFEWDMMSISTGQAQEQMFGLRTSLGRLREEERKRLTEGLGKMPEMARAEITRGSRGTFSARGAGMLGFGTSKIITDDVNGKVIVKELVGIRQEIRGAIPVFK